MDASLPFDETRTFCGNRLASIPAAIDVLLDLKMPGMRGFDVLKWIRQQPGLKALRAAMLASSESPSEIKRAHDLGANIFLTKPVQLERLVQIRRTLNEHWLQPAQSPPVS
jgi:CheY-like chemotaxis protein